MVVGQQAGPPSSDTWGQALQAPPEAAKTALQYCLVRPLLVLA